MFGRVKIQKLDDFFLTLDKRDGRGIYFYRINGYNSQIGEFIRKYYEAARSEGVVIEGRIPNPDGRNLAYYQEIMGTDFQLSKGFIASSLKKWLPRMGGYQRDMVADSLYAVLYGLRNNGKNEHMLKNAYVKIMCWLYYRFERIAGRLGNDRVPKILYEGEISYYELLLMEILSSAGCDIVLLQYGGDGNYRKLDGESSRSDCLELPGMGNFPEGFSLEGIRRESRERQHLERLYGKLPEIMNCTNAWISGKGLEDIRTEAADRGNDPNLFYNCFIRINGVEDKLAYRNELYQFQAVVKGSRRRLVVVDGEIPPPSTEEIAAIRRKKYARQEDMLLDLSANIRCTADEQLERLLVKGFLDVVLEAAADGETGQNGFGNRPAGAAEPGWNRAGKQPTHAVLGQSRPGSHPASVETGQNGLGNQPAGVETGQNGLGNQSASAETGQNGLGNQSASAETRQNGLGNQPAGAEMKLTRLTNQAVVLLCWLRRYQDRLFAGWKMPETACFIHMGGCRNGREAMFLRLLARLPVDVLVLNPDRNMKCCLQDKFLYEINYEESLAVKNFPKEDTGLQIGTAAYQAERELDTLMYGDSGMYRNQQYGKSVSVTLQTTYEEIAILWKQELKYRPGFSTAGDVVSMPVIFAKVSGVKERNLPAYWAGIRALLTDETYLVRSAPCVDSMEENPVKPYAAGFIRDGRLQRDKIRKHPSYQYGMLREAVQEHILDKLQMLIDCRMVKGIFQNGTEYTAIATVLNMKKELVRLIQKFDFTRVNPKIVYINAEERTVSLEDSILTAFLNLAGFDVVFFVPTGYQSVEGYFNRELMEEHQAGEYMFGLDVPDLASRPGNARQTWRERIFKRK